ncbi:hypothetical protein RHGRI_015001 [Rhododendron griersonianum]|uniref:Prp31 C-terminal domain-containing protein n=1 Tax=Rhododendron griersonianum TaxID=479676 RepID=A0AAV6KBM3_9ERIC|nr:hypothetical protein RHGRI_015001 [Rhododendron griersonianum]
MGASMDSVSECPAGNKGRALCDKIRKTIEKLQQLPPAKRPKPLQILDCKPKKKRGGRWLRRMKQRYEITSERKRKRANRMYFGRPEE